MKKQLLLALCALISIVSYGQVRLMDNTPVQKEDTIVTYDSLSNFQLMYHGEHYDYCHLKGQTMIYCGIPYRGYPKNRFKVGDAFYIKDIIHTEPHLAEHLCFTIPRQRPYTRKTSVLSRISAGLSMAIGPKSSSYA